MTRPSDPAFLISAARLRLHARASAGLLAEIGYSLDHHADASLPSLATDGQALKYNAVFIAQLSDDELETALAHEYAHVALLHPVRYQPQHDKQTANKAMDYAVNLWLTDAGFKIPADWLFDRGFAGMSWENIYAILAQPQPPAPTPPPPEQGDDEQEPPADDARNPQDNEDEPANTDAPGQEDDAADDDAHAEPGQPGDVQGDVQPYPGRDGEPATEQELSEATAELTDRIMRIAQAQEQAGTASSDTRRLVESMTTPRDPDLYDALAALLERSADEHTWRRINRRLLHAGIYPGLDGEKCPPLVVAVDTSGSISDAMLFSFSDKIRRAVADFRPLAVTVIYCDSRINAEPVTYTPDETITLTPHGGGGTDFRPPFAWVAEHMPEPPAALVYLTDLDGVAPPAAPEYPVIWAVIPQRYGHECPHFGQIIPLNL